MDLCDLPSDFIFSNIHGASTEMFKNMIEKYIKKANMFVVVSPEYHGSYPGIFKALIDCIGNEFIKDKKVALVGLATGRVGNLRGMEHLTSLFHHLKAEVLSSKPKLSEVHKLQGEHGEINNPETVKLLQDQIDSFVKF